MNKELWQLYCLLKLGTSKLGTSKIGTSKLGTSKLGTSKLGTIKHKWIGNSLDFSTLLSMDYLVTTKQPEILQWCIESFYI